jgi:hypothetical protein
MLTEITRLVRKYYAGIISLFIFIVYLFTLARSVMEIDSGELAAVQSTLGIAHPTGYPLFVMIGHLLLKIPLPFSTIYKTNLFAAFWCALGIWILIKSVSLVLNKQNFTNDQAIKPKQKKNTKQSAAPAVVNSKEYIIVSTVCAGLILAFSKTFWDQSTSVEVYSMQVFLIGLIIYVSLRTYFSANNKLTDWCLFGFVLALGFSNHMTTLLLLPFPAILFFQKEKFTLSALKKIFFALAVFIPTLILIYSYLPIRASQNPVMNWGNPINLDNFLRHVSGKQYRVWLFSSLDAAKKHLGDYLASFPGESGYIGLIAGIIGIFYSFKKDRKIFSALAVTFILAVLYSVNYDIADLASYFVTSYIIFSFFIAYGFIKLITFLRDKFKKEFFAIAAAVIISLFPLILNYADTNESDVHIYEDYTRAILNKADKNSIVFSYQWDYFTAAAYYFQNVENYRKDVVIIDKELLRRSWYYNQLKRNYPDLFSNMETEVSNFLTAVKPFEQDEQFDSGTIESCYRSVMTNLISSNIEKRSYYIGPELFQNEMQRGEFSLPSGYQITPDLFLFKVSKGNDYVPSPDPDFTIRFPNKHNHYIDFIENTVAGMLAYRAYYELQFNKPDRAKIYINKIRKDFPDYQLPSDLANK